MVYDDDAAERAVRELASITDAQQVREIRAALDDAVAEWRTWRTGPDYPRPSGRFRPMMNDLDSEVNATAKAAAALPAEPAVHQVVKVASPILGASIPDWGTIRPFTEAVDRLRRLAMHRTRLVDDARRLTRRGPA